MREIVSGGSSPIINVTRVQNFLYPQSRIKSKKLVIVPKDHVLWAGIVIESENTSPRLLYDELKNAFDEYVELDISISLSMRLVRYYKLYEFYWYGQDHNDIISVKIWDQYKFAAQLVKGFDTMEGKLMRTRDSGILRIEESLVYFKETRLGIIYGTVD